MNTAVLYFVELLVLAPSNYVLQIVIGTTIHYGYGLGLYGKVGAVQGFVLSVAVFAMQMPLSALYLARLPTGPLEWLWRRISHGRPAVSS
ncbi:MAG: DUF418 domain-containing protein [Acidobacteria bacterium]|nr:DUF418 domain-containing protein [Acidobacteriota bacterium]